MADSLCCQLENFSNHAFTVVLPEFMEATANRLEARKAIGGAGNVHLVRHTLYPRGTMLLSGREAFMDSLVSREGIEAVLTVFGPSAWRPRAPHLVGFARAHLVLPGSPFFRRLPLRNRLKERALSAILGYFFRSRSDALWSENPMITQRVQGLMQSKPCYTVTNCYNQIFDNPDGWIQVSLAPFDGATFLSINAPYPHKNMEIAIDIARILRREHPEFRFRFVFTITAADYVAIPPELEPHFVLIGKVDVAQVPSLYCQATVMFQPTLLECFSATYTEAMRMDVPIVTTDLDFARGLCGEAALYYSALDAAEAAEALHCAATDAALRARLIAAGRSQLSNFDTYESRARKLIDLTADTAVTMARNIRLSE